MRQASANTFAATVRVRRRMAGAPFGRLDISDERVTVRSWLPAWIGPHSVPRATITEVTVYGWPAIYIKFTDDHGTLLDVVVNPVRSGRVIREFHARGYPVVDLRPAPAPGLCLRRPARCAPTQPPCHC